MKVAHAIVVAEAIRAAHIGCDDPTRDVVPDPGTVVNPVTEQVSCDIGDDSVVINLFRDYQEMLTLGLPYMRQGSCYMQDHQSPDTSYPANLTFVEGENWIVFPQEPTAEKVATSVGGCLRINAC